MRERGRVREREWLLCFANALCVHVHSVAGAGIIGPGLTSIMTGGAAMSNLRPRDAPGQVHIGGNGMEHHAYQQLRSLSEDRQVCVCT